MVNLDSDLTSTIMEFCQTDNSVYGVAPANKNHVVFMEYNDPFNYNISNLPKYVKNTFFLPWGGSLIAP